MSKIICDVCGTSYPESATQCPICGCVRPADITTVQINSDEKDTRPNGTYTYVKGGRFSKANVKKRNQGKPVVNADPAPKTDNSDAEDVKKNSTGFIVAVTVLLVAIVAVAIYIAVRFLSPGLPDNSETNITTAPTGDSTTVESTSDTALCEKIDLNKSTITFDHPGAAIYVTATLTPADTTERVKYISADDSVATVDDEGRITAVGSGETTITVICGSAEATCQIVCNFESVSGSQETTETTGETTPETTESVNNEFDPSSLKLNWTYTMVEDETVGDVTMVVGTEWVAYTDREGKIPSSEIVFSTSDPSVATIDEKGVVKAIGVGEVYIVAEYGGNIVKCRIICV